MPTKKKSNPTRRPSPQPESALEAAPLSDLNQIMKELLLEPPTGTEFLSDEARTKVFVDAIGQAYATAQQLPFLFPSKPLSRKSPALSLSNLPEWHEWSKRHKLMNGDQIEAEEDAEKMITEMGKKSVQFHFNEAFGLDCSEEHATSSWPVRKKFCLRSAYPDLFLSRAKAAGCVLVPLVSAPYFVDGKNMEGMNFFNIGFQGQGAGTKSKMQDSGKPAKNEHGQEKFLVKVQKGGRVLIYDEERTFQTSFGAQMIDPKKWSRADAEAYEKPSVEVRSFPEIRKRPWD
ncbi:hypothetical protein P7C70_g2957, partial [Phenoliferia sp. Uapishka_3]